MHSNHFRNMLDWSMESSSILSWDQPEGGAAGGSGPPNGNIRHGGVSVGGSGMGGGTDSMCSSYYDIPPSLATSMTGSMMSSMASACLTPCTPVSFYTFGLSRLIRLHSGWHDKTGKYLNGHISCTFKSFLVLTKHPLLIFPFGEYSVIFIRPSGR